MPFRKHFSGRAHGPGGNRISPLYSGWPKAWAAFGYAKEVYGE